VPGGGAVHARAAAAFTDAFNLASMVSIAVVVAAAVAVLVVARTTREDTVDELADEALADEEPGLDLGLATAVAGQTPE
jgi:hypothetical protein